MHSIHSILYVVLSDWSHVNNQGAGWPLVHWQSSTLQVGTSPSLEMWAHNQEQHPCAVCTICLIEFVSYEGNIVTLLGYLPQRQARWAVWPFVQWYAFVEKHTYDCGVNVAMIQGATWDLSPMVSVFIHQPTSPDYLVIIMLLCIDLLWKRYINMLFYYLCILFYLVFF